MAPGNSRVAAESLLDVYASRHDEWARGLWLALLPDTMKQGWDVAAAKPPSWFRIENCSIHLLRELWERGFAVHLPPEYDYAKRILGMFGDESSSEGEDTPSTTTTESANDSPARSRLFEADPTDFPAPATSSAAARSKKKSKGKRKGKPKKKAGMAPPSALDPTARDFDPSVEEKEANSASKDDTKGVNPPSPPPPSAPMSSMGPTPSAAPKRKKRGSKKRASRRQTREAQTGTAEVTAFTTTETITDAPEDMKTSQSDNPTGGVVAPTKGHETSDNPEADEMLAASMAAVEPFPLTARSLKLLGCTRPCFVNTLKWQEGWADWTKAELAEYGEQDAETTLKQLVDEMNPSPIIFMPKPNSEPASSITMD